MTATDTQLATLFVDFSRRKLLEYGPRLEACVGSLSEEQVWWRPNESSNSIGNLLLHLNGNIGQWVIASFNRRADGRNRPQEFNEGARIPVTELLARLRSTVEQAAETIARLTVDDLLGTYEIQGYSVRGLDAVYHAVEHFGIHYGQIVYITKNLCGKDMGFYRELDKTGRA